MTEVLFYHLEHQPRSGRCREGRAHAGARLACGGAGGGRRRRVEALDTCCGYTEDSFSARTKRDGKRSGTAVYLTTEEANPNGATVRFSSTGAEISEHAGYERNVYMFDGSRHRCRRRAREQGKRPRPPAADQPYWQQSPEGRWEKKA